MYTHTHIEETGNSIFKNDEMLELEQDVCSPGQSPVYRWKRRPMEMAIDKWSSRLKSTLISEAKHVQEELTDRGLGFLYLLGSLISVAFLIMPPPPRPAPHISPTEGKGGGEKKKKWTKPMGFLPRKNPT